MVCFVLSSRARLRAVRALTLGLAALCVLTAGVAYAADDADVVAALDMDYQAAVKNNDSATMARILADDFVLVTGTGKAFNKNDLLGEARSGRVAYERQEASARRG